MTRSEVARKAKLDPSVLWRLENPKTGAQPTFELVRRVARALGVSMDAICDLIERPKVSSEPTLQDQLDRISRAVDALRRLGESNARKPQK